MQASARLSSSAAFRKAIAGVSSATTRSCYRTSRGKAHAAPLPAQEPPLKGRKRATKQEREVRIMEYVENYRASNEGKFPTIKNIRQQLGGGHYEVRDVLSEMKDNHAKLPPDNPKAAPLQETDGVTEHPMQKAEARVLESQVIQEASEQSMAEDDAEVAQRQGTVEVSKHSTPNDDAEVAQLQGTVQVSEHSFPKDEGKVDQCQGTFQLPDLSCGKTAKHDMDTAADAPALSDQTESERMEDLTVNPDPGKQQREIEANKFDLKDSEKPLNTNDSNGSDQSGGDMVNEAKTHARDDNPKHEESTNTGLLGSLKSFAYGIRNFWKNM